MKVNEYYFFKLWKYSGLDIIGVVSYAAKYSVYNNIEHTWSLISKNLFAMILLSVLERDSTHPWKQTELIKDERRHFCFSNKRNYKCSMTDVLWKNCILRKRSKYLKYTFLKACIFTKYDLLQSCFSSILVKIAFSHLKNYSFVNG